MAVAESRGKEAEGRNREVGQSMVQLETKWREAAGRLMEAEGKCRELEGKLKASEVRDRTAAYGHMILLLQAIGYITKKRSVLHGSKMYLAHGQGSQLAVRLSSAYRWVSGTPQRRF